MASVSLTADELDEIAQRAAAIVVERTSATDRAQSWLTVEEAAEHLALSVSQLYTLCSQRRTNGLPLVKEGSRSYFKASELDAWRASR